MSDLTLIEHPRHILREEMAARGWEDSDLLRGMDQETGLAALVYLYVADAEPAKAGDGVLEAIARRFGLSETFILRLDEAYRTALDASKEPT